MKRLAVLTTLMLATTTWLASPSLAAKAPNTVIKTGPLNTVASTTATFTFKAKPKKGAKFTCRMDAGRWKKCTSPATYTGLAQGAHTFAVRAKRNKVTDPTPATRSFVVDTVAPETVIDTAPSAVTDDHTPTFAFSANEPGATFTCKLDASAFAPCTSPVTLPETPDSTHVVQVRARDAVGNVDGTPATTAFEILTPLTKDLATAEAAAAFVVPDTLDLDVPANCASNPQIDCPSGTPLPPTDQVHLTATRSLVDQLAGADRADVTALVDLTTLVPIKLTSSGTTCDLTLTSANGANPKWKLDFQEQFVHPAGSTEWRIEVGNAALTQVDDADVVLSGGGICSILPVSTFKNQLTTQLAQQFQTTLCAASGPAYLGICPP